MRFMPHAASDFQILRKIKSWAVSGYTQNPVFLPWHSSRSCVFASLHLNSLPGICVEKTSGTQGRQVAEIQGRGKVKSDFLLLVFLAFNSLFENRCCSADPVIDLLFQQIEREGSVAEDDIVKLP